MSYILDALRRAEADRERERGKVPGLHTQAPSGGEAASTASPRRWLPWAGGGLLLLAGIGAGSWWASGPQEAASPALPAAPAAPAPVVTTAAVPAPAAAPVAPATAPQPAASGSPFLAPAPPPGAAVAPPTPRPANVAAPAPAAVVATPAGPPAPAAEAPVPRLADLPDSTRRELPSLAIGGSVYSDDPSNRMVIINGQVLREGARLSADLVLEQIRPRELVLRFKGQRYRQPV